MGKNSEIFKKLTAKLFAEDTSEKIDITLEDDTVLTVDKLEKDGVAMIGTDLANSGEYKTKEGKIVVVGENGKITEVKEKETTEETQMSDTPAEPAKVEAKIFSIKTFSGYATLKDGTSIMTTDEFFKTGSPIFTTKYTETEGYVSTPVAADVVTADGTKFTVVDGKISKMDKEVSTEVQTEDTTTTTETQTEASNDSASTEAKMAEFADRLDEFESILVKFNEMNEKELKSIKEDVKLFSSSPAPTNDNKPVVDLSNVPTKASSGFSYSGYKYK